MNGCLIVALFCLSPFCLCAQKPPTKFGEVSIEDLKMTRYAKDSSAAAVVLMDYGETIIEYNQSSGFELHFERLTRIKILSKEGLDWANLSIPLYHDGSDNEKITNLKAITYNLENGKISETKLKNDAIFTEKIDANVDYTKVTFPNVRVGSVVEITYKVTSDFLFNLQDWEFQRTIPAVWSEYRARIPEYFSYDKYMQGYVVLSINDQTKSAATLNITSKERSNNGAGATQTTFSQDRIDFQETRFRWAANDIPAFKPEPFITTYRDYISKINFELAYTSYPNQPIKTYMGSWADINKQYAESADFGEEVSGNGFLKKIVEEVTAGTATPEDKVQAVGNYLKQNVSWDENSRRFTTKPLKKVLEDKKGNSAEINLLFASMLDKANIKVRPVLLSTRDHGFVRENTPISSQFNYVICAASIGDKIYLLDATEKLLPIGMLPERCLNGNGLAISKEGFQWLNLQTATKSRTVMNVDLALVASGELNGKLIIERGGYDGLASRKRYLTEEEKEYVKDFVGGNSWEITQKEITNVKEIHLPMKETYELVMSEQITSAGDVIYLNPLLLERIEENPFKLENREYPVNYTSPFERTYMCKILIPEGYVVDELPKSKAMALPANAGKYTYSVTQTGSTLSIISNFTINKSIFTQPEYPNLREFYNQVVAKQAEQIVLKRK
jgi:transglutaminase-like putative cysteine protease